MALLDDIKTLLRIKNTAFDTEISDLIAACKTDLAQAGVLKIVDTDSLIKRAISTYTKANFGWNNPDAEKLQLSYEMLMNHLSMSTDYAYFIVTINAGIQCEVTFDGDTKQTNDSGTVIFYSKPKNHVEYIIDGIISHVDITNDTTIGA